jgi:hypothetical protein
MHYILILATMWVQEVVSDYAAATIFFMYGGGYKKWSVIILMLWTSNAQSAGKGMTNTDNLYHCSCRKQCIKWKTIATDKVVSYCVYKVVWRCYNCSFTYALQLHSSLHLLMCYLQCCWSIFFCSPDGTFVQVHYWAFNDQ